MKARKTEYRGITFASKSEARLALFLDHQKLNWWYEPESMRLPDGYVPDFLIASFRQVEEANAVAYHCGNGWMELSVIEFKPSRPTQTYIEELAVRMGKISDLMFEQAILDAMADSVFNANFVLLTGGMGYDKAEHLHFWGTTHYGKNRPCIQSRWRSGWGDLLHDCGRDTPDAVNKSLRDYRFDLAQQTGVEQ